MIDRIPFSTRARTVDHLGREQIADCPTAISELWKNSYDAYARNVDLHIFDGSAPVSAVVDDGHGMSRSEFEEKWLVVGTESKKVSSNATKQDRLGLPVRIRQGQKGIGRLSCAALGSLALIVSKRRKSSFVGSLIDWRLFENPYLFLSDVQLPVVEFAKPDELLEQMPTMFDTLVDNIWGSKDDQERKRRLTAAWLAFDDWEDQQGRESSTREAIEKVAVAQPFLERHLECWPVWTNDAKSGTALFSADISYDLTSLLEPADVVKRSPNSQSAHDRAIQTLSGFIDPYIESLSTDDEFHYGIRLWRGDQPTTFLSDDREFDGHNFHLLEHIVEGQVDESGVFQGKVKAFGEWLQDPVVIMPSSRVPTESKKKAGGFRLRMGAYEGELINTTLADEDHAFIQQVSTYNSGLFLYRDGLRVLPFGRPDNDFFEIEKRRTTSAGRHFWSYRRMFGSIEISSISNPNLVDKAGREGLIDNQAAKVFRDIVEGILTKSASRYLGSDSEIRKPTIAQIRAEKQEAKRAEQEKRLARKRRRDFRERVRAQKDALESLKLHLKSFASQVDEAVASSRMSDLQKAKATLAELESNLHSLSVDSLPSGMESFKPEYLSYASTYRLVEQKLGQSTAIIVESIAALAASDQETIWESEVTERVKKLQASSGQEISELKQLQDEVWKKIRLYGDDSANEFLARVKEHHKISRAEKTPLGMSLLYLEELFVEARAEVEQFYSGAQATLEAVRDNFDLNLLAEKGMDERIELREELSRINALAQLGITVEIIGHELATLDAMITSGLNSLEHSTKQTRAFQRTVDSHKALTDRLNFLSPLKLSGKQSREDISGREIFRYAETFFGQMFSDDGIEFAASSEFKKFRFNEKRSRILPVFVNLLNNSRYWIAQKENEGGRILLDVRDGKIIVADDGPGVEPEDIDSLFSLFFTRKPRGGRGVGLYLCRSNLAAGGHHIHYAQDPHECVLSGANFVITLLGAADSV